MDSLPKESGEKLEQNYVKSTYDKIADEFSGTRYKKWPKVDAFLKDLPKNCILLDIGCGNGKYLDNESTLNIGCDTSSKLLSICRTRGFEVVHCDMISLPFKSATFDAIICVAALHHIVTAPRRQKCIEDFIDLLSENGKLLIQVWSFEQELEKDNPYLRRSKTRLDSREGGSIDGEVAIDGNIKIRIHKNRTPFASQDLLVPFHLKNSAGGSKLKAVDEDTQHLRYYHLFKEKELESMLELIPNAKIVDSYYDKGNWCAIITKT